jgi:hypothetical protein
MIDPESSMTLKEYRQIHPNTDGFPTLTQRGAVRVLLEREHRSAARRAVRGAFWDRVSGTFRATLQWLWRGHMASLVRHSVARIAGTHHTRS